MQYSHVFTPEGEMGKWGKRWLIRSWVVSTFWLPSFSGVVDRWSTDALMVTGGWACTHTETAKKGSSVCVCRWLFCCFALFFFSFFFNCRACSTETGVVTPWLPQIVCGWDWHARSSVARTDRSTGVTTAHRHATTSHVSTFGSDVTHPSPSRHFKRFHILFYFVRFCFVLIRLGCVGSSNTLPSCSLAFPHLPQWRN